MQPQAAFSSRANPVDRIAAQLQEESKNQADESPLQQRNQPYSMKESARKRQANLLAKKMQQTRISHDQQIDDEYESFEDNME